MRKKYRSRVGAGFGFIIMTILLTGCGSFTISRGQSAVMPDTNTDSGNGTTIIGSYDSADTAVIRGVNTEENNITLVHLETGKPYTLSYDGTTVTRDKYEGIMSMEQLKAGDIVDVKFLKNSKKLSSIMLSPAAFSYDSISKYTFNQERKSAAIGEDVYQLKNSIQVFSEDRNVGIEDIVSKDVITVKGIGRNIYSVSVEKGHGYLRLENDAYVIGGWIEVGQALIQQVTDHMMLTVPEGSYDIRITGKGVDTIRQVTIERNKEVTLDLGDIEIEEIKMGKIFFTVEPEDAAIYIDGEETDIGKPVELDYGLHQIMAKAAGYATLTQYIKVSQDIASIHITMEEGESADEDTDTTSTVSGNELSTGTYKVYIDSPVGVEVYVDGVYKGMCPVSFAKVAGTYTLTLRKQGYISKSYTITIDNDENDVTFSFSDLEKDKTVSGNSTDNKDSGKSQETVSDNSTVSENDSVSDN